MSLFRRLSAACAASLAAVALAPAAAQPAIVPAPARGPASVADPAAALPDAPSFLPSHQPAFAFASTGPEQPAAFEPNVESTGVSSSLPSPAEVSLSTATAPLYAYTLLPASLQQTQQTRPPAPQQKKPNSSLTGPELDADGNPIPLENRQPRRILGIMPNFRTVAAGSRPHPPGWRYNFTVATHQAFDYSTFVFLGLTTLSAEGINAHPALGKGVEGFGNYLWRGFLDKTDNTYLSAWLLASLLHEDTRYYPLGHGHRIATRTLYVISRQAVTRTYGGRDTFNFAGLGGKVLTQYISRYYYPSGTTDFSALATKFAYSAMRDIGFSAIREFYPDAAAHFIRKHREKVARAQAAAITGEPSTPVQP